MHRFGGRFVRCGILKHHQHRHLHGSDQPDDRFTSKQRGNGMYVTILSILYMFLPLWLIDCLHLPVAVSNMDARRMEFIPDQCFDLVLDKGNHCVVEHWRLMVALWWRICCVMVALFDAILCAEANLHDIDSLIREMWRVLKTDGHYIVISHAPPERRLPHFSRILPGVHVEISRIGKSSDVFAPRCVDDHDNVGSVACYVVKQELKDLEEEGDSKYHFMYVLTKVQV